LLLRNGRNVLLLLCGEVSWRWVVGLVARVMSVQVGIGMGVGVSFGMGIRIRLSMGLVAIVADVGIVARRVFVYGRLGGLDSLHWSLHKAEVVGEVDHGSLRVAGVFECGRGDCGVLFALTAARASKEKVSLGEPA